jgi:hypothetical protein
LVPGYEGRTGILAGGGLAQVRQLKIFFAILKKIIFDVNQSEAIWVTMSP